MEFKSFGFLSAIVRMALCKTKIDEENITWTTGGLIAKSDLFKTTFGWIAKITERQNCRHAKIDQETQSPLLNIFKEIMTREKDDPEKRNLLNEHREDKKRRQHTLPKNKSDRSSNSEHRKRASHPYKVSSTEQRAEFHNKARSQSMPYQTEKKDSWWFWQNCTPPTRKPESTCSCVSCALKKIARSEYACIGCLLLLFTISIIIAFLVVFKSVPSGDCKVLECKECKGSPPGVDSSTPKCKDCGVADSERLKRKIEMLSSKRMRNGFVGVDEFRKNDKQGYDDVLSGQDAAGIAGIDFGPSFRELNSVDDSENKFADLSNVLRPDKNLVDTQSSEKLREFYKRLVETDAKIKLLTKKQAETPDEEGDIQMSPERSRRSLKLYHYPTRYRVFKHRRSLFGKHPKVNENGITKTKAGNKTRSKRSESESKEPTGFIIEKKKLLVQFKPAGKKRIQPVKKCQHAPVGTHTHEKQMMHPFYKNTQRLDLLLDKFLNKNIPEIMTDPFGVDEFFKQDTLRKPCKHPKPHKNVNIIGDGQLVDQIPKPKFKFKSKVDKFKKTKEDKTDVGYSKPDLFKMLTPESTTKFVKDFYNHEAKMIGKELKKIVTSSPSDFEVLLSVSTIMNPDLQKLGKTSSNFKADKPKRLLEKVPNLRRLMQFETVEDEDNLGYEDFKEVLTDDMDNHDEMEKVGDRKRRENDQPVQEQSQAVKYQKFNPPSVGVHNPNWKGAMPLYQDEINSIINNKGEQPTKPTDETQELLAVQQRKSRDLSDVEYVEDYLADKYDKLVQQAQAYSDYGVLDGKKESRNEKDSPTADSATNHKIKLSADENFHHKAGLLARLKRGRVPRVVTTGTAKKRRQEDASATEAERITPAQTGFNINYIRKETPNSRLSEGIRVEICPCGTKPREDTKIDFKKIVSQHLKIVPKSKQKAVNRKQDSKIATAVYPHYIHSTIVSIDPNVGRVYTTENDESTTEATTAFKYDIGDLDEKRLLLTMTGGSRRLLSTGFESSSDFRDYKDSSGYRGGNQERNISSIDKFVDKHHLNNNFNLTNYQLVKNYIEGVTQMNINMFSSPPPFDSGDLISEMYDSFTEDNSQSSDPLRLPNFGAGFPDALVTINKSSINSDFVDNFFGKILLTVKDPEFGMQNFNLIFDVPLLLNLKEEIRMMSDSVNYPNIYNQFEVMNDATGDPLVSDVESYHDLFVNKTSSKRSKRDANVTEPWSDSNATAVYAEEYFNGTETPDLKETDSITATVFGTSCSNFSDFQSTLSVQSNETTNLNSTLKIGRSVMNASAAVADNMTLSDFFSVIANWFTALEYGKDVKPKNSSGSVLTDMLHILNGNMTSASNISGTVSSVSNINNNVSSLSNISSTVAAYPMYDSDMIENIGHRSRVLLSIEEHVSNVTEENKAGNNINATEVTAVPSVDGNVSNGTTSKSLITAFRRNQTTTKLNQDKKTFLTPKKDTKQKKVKAIVKRNADDSNLIFWNDIYDDEYGIQTDKMDTLDSVISDKRSVKQKDFLKRSGRWVQNKFRKFTKNLKINPHSDGVSSVHSDNLETKDRIPRHSHSLNPKDRVPRSVPHSNDHGWAYSGIHDGVGDHAAGSREIERDEIEEDYPDIDQKSLFAALSANMKEVCKKAAKAVQQTRNMDHLPDTMKRNEAQEEYKQGSIANALMQQLVRLLTELVNYQVQQKTCRKLPDDLQTFLEWLTYSREEPDESDNQSNLLFKPAVQEDEELIEQLQDSQEDIAKLPDDMLLADKEELADDRSRYLENLHSVQSLLQQYDQMSDDDKSKMTGVKGYLQKQLDVLNRQLSAHDLYNFFDKNSNNDRKKRDIIMTQHLKTTHRPRRNSNRHKFLKKFGKKHTRTTASGYDEANQVTDVIMNREPQQNGGRVHSTENANHKLMKRNLKDVYYKAVAEAKKYSTAKSFQKKDEISIFETSSATRLA